MAAAAYRHLARQLEDADLFRTADLVRETLATPGFKFIADSIAEHERKMNDQLLNETTKPEDIGRLRGLITGLGRCRKRAQSILEYAEERERRPTNVSGRRASHERPDRARGGHVRQQHPRSRTVVGAEPRHVRAGRRPDERARGQHRQPVRRFRAASPARSRAGGGA
jgi:hypothetical protein